MNHHLAQNLNASNEENHSLYKCHKLAVNFAREKREFVLSKKLCFAWLRKECISKDCKKVAICSLCRGKHSTTLHENRPLAADPPVGGSLQNEGSTLSFSCSMAGGGDEIHTGIIMEVWISSSSISSSETLAYALLNTQSSHTFAD